MQQELKILKNGSNVYVAYENTGASQECSMKGNLGHCWLACNGYHCPLNCKTEHYKTISNSLIGTPIDRIYEIRPGKYDTTVKLKEIYNIIKNTQVADAISAEEQESLMSMIHDSITDPEGNIIDNRIVHNKTFAVRLYHFLIRLKGDDMRLPIIQNFAKCLFAYQIATVTSEEEQKYLKNLIFPYSIVSY